MTPAERARAIVDQHLWPTREGPFVRVNDQPRDLERLIEVIAGALIAQAADELIAAAHEVVSMPFALVDGDWTQHQMNGRFTAAMGRLRVAVTNAAEAAALTGAPPASA